MHHTSVLSDNGSTLITHIKYEVLILCCMIFYCTIYITALMKKVIKYEQKYYYSSLKYISE